MAHQPRQQLIGQARFPCAAGAGNTDHRDARPGTSDGAPDLLGLRLAVPGALRNSPFQDRDRPAHLCVIARIEGTKLIGGPPDRAHPRENVVDHSIQTEFATVLRGVDLFHPVTLERLDLLRGYRSAAADDHANVFAATFPQHLDHVREVLVVAALIGTHRNGVCVLLDRRPHNVRDAAVMAKVHDFGAVRLQQAADHVDRGVVAVEQRGGGNEAQGALGQILLGAGLRLLHLSYSRVGLATGQYD